MKPVLSYSKLSSFLLFFCISFILFYFFGIDTEYNLNQQIDRGFISRDAIFFRIYDPSDTGLVIVSGIDEAGNEYREQITERDANILEDPTYVMDNQIDMDGRTRVENILAAPKGNYLASVHKGMGRYVYFSGQISSPPLLSGRFFTQKECLSREALAVIGSKYKESMIKIGDDSFIEIEGILCRVIGITGIPEPSTMDSLYFLNLGCIPPQQQLAGRYYIDQTNEPSVIWNDMNDASLRQFNLPLVKLTIPTTMVDIVAGGVYLKDYLKIATLLLLAFIYVSILGQTMSSERAKIGIFKVNGVSMKIILRRVHLPILLSGLTGILVAVLVGSILIIAKHFSLPISVQFCLLGTCVSVAFFLLIVWLLVFLASAQRICLREVLQV